MGATSRRAPFASASSRGAPAIVGRIGQVEDGGGGPGLGGHFPGDGEGWAFDGGYFQACPLGPGIKRGRPRQGGGGRLA
jgi:hypothetical protein